ncbi:MAG: hypothetical protein RSC48_05190 [Anaerorhabdus sp.]
MNIIRTEFIFLTEINFDLFFMIFSNFMFFLKEFWTEVLNKIDIFIPIIVAIIAYFGVERQLVNNRKDRYANIIITKKLEILII